jgi:hypothetical protein
VNRRLPIVAAGILLLTLTGCQPEPTTTHSPSPSPSPSASAEALSCENIVTPEAWASLTSGGSVLSDDFVERMKSGGSDLLEFLDRHGVICQWGLPNTDSVTVLAYSPIDGADAKTQEKRLVADGWTSQQQHGGGVLLTKLIEGDDYEQAYLFRAGDWRYASDVGSLDAFVR